MTRKNNKKDMTITEQLERVKDQICIDYCKFRHGMKIEIITCDELVEICKTCPMNEV